MDVLGVMVKKNRENIQFINVHVDGLSQGASCRARSGSRMKITCRSSKKEEHNGQLSGNPSSSSMMKYWNILQLNKDKASCLWSPGGTITSQSSASIKTTDKRIQTWI